MLVEVEMYKRLNTGHPWKSKGVGLLKLINVDLVEPQVMNPVFASHQATYGDHEVEKLWKVHVGASTYFVNKQGKDALKEAGEKLC